MKGQTQKISISLDDSDDEGLALLIPDIQETTTLVQSATYSEILTKDENQQNMNSLEYQMNSSIEQKYLEVMKKLQFGEFFFCCLGFKNFEKIKPYKCQESGGVFQEFSTKLYFELTKPYKCLNMQPAFRSLLLKVSQKIKIYRSFL